MARGKGHVFNFTRIPCAYDVAATVRVMLERVNDLFDLIRAAAVAGTPVGPLSAIDAAKVAVFVGPLVPNMNLVIFQVLDISIPFEKPE